MRRRIYYNVILNDTRRIKCKTAIIKFTPQFFARPVAALQVFRIWTVRFHYKNTSYILPSYSHFIAFYFIIIIYLSFFSFFSIEFVQKPKSFRKIYFVFFFNYNSVETVVGTNLFVVITTLLRVTRPSYCSRSKHNFSRSNFVSYAHVQRWLVNYKF